MNCISQSIGTIISREENMSDHQPVLLTFLLLPTDQIENAMRDAYNIAVPQVEEEEEDEI